MQDKITFSPSESSVHIRALKPQRTRMRAISAMVFLALCAMMVIIYQAVQQEFNIRALRARIVASGDQVKLKEDGIMAAKGKVDDMNKQLAPLTTQKDQLKKQTDDLKKSTVASEKEMGICQTEKAKLEKQSTEANGVFEKLKGDQDAERKKAEEEIKGLKQQILDRDLKICNYVDIALEETKKFCSAAL